MRASSSEPLSRCAARVVLVILLRFLLQSAVTAGVGRVLPDGEAGTQAALLAAGIVGWLVPTVMLRHGMERIPAQDGARRTDAPALPWWLAAAGGAFLVGWLADSLLCGGLALVGIRFAGDAMPQGALARGIWLLNTLAAAPLLEELFFRGTLLPALRRYGDRFALLASAVLFAAVHVTPTAWPAALLQGALFGAAYLGTGSLLVPLAMHVVHNLLALAQTADAPAWAATLFAAALSGFGIAAAVRLSQAYKMQDSQKNQEHPQETLRAFFGNVPMALAAVFLLLAAREAML
jgi:hypothetical protein